MLTTADYAMVLDNALKKNKSIVIACNCTIRYSGRAESFLDEGDRVILIKKDKSIIIHQPTGNNPVNYMKPDTTHNIVLNRKILLIKSKNIPLKEYMDIQLNEIYFLNSRHLTDTQSIIIRGTEKDMAHMIFENPSLIEDGFKPLTMEEHTKYGFIDVFGRDKDNILTIVECKRYCGDLNAVSQLRRYVEKVQSAKGVSSVRGILACPKITSNALKMLEDFGYKFVSVNPPNYMERFDKNQKTLDGF